MINIIFIIIGTLGLLIPIFTIFVLINELYTRKTMSKKNIKDYLGKKYAVVCKTKEDWDKLVKLTNCNKPNYFERSVSKCFDLCDVGTYWGTSNIKEIESVYGREIIPASDFLEEGKSSDSLKIEDLVEGKVYKFYFSENKSGIISKYNSSTFQTSKNIGPYIMFDTYYNKEHLSVTLPKLEIKNITEDELKWYNVCVSRDCFVNKEEALKVVEKPQFEVGKWYKSPKWSDFWIKVDSFSNGKVYCKEIITDKELKTENKNYDYCLETYVQLTDLSEIQQYLPPNHPDLIVEKKELYKDELLEEAKRKYPIGTKFKCLHLGSTRTVTEEATLDSPDCIRVNDSCACIYDYHSPGKWAEIISLPESKTEVMEEFKVGDTVKLKPNSKGGGQHVVGNIYKIVSDDTKPKYGLEGIDKSGHLKVWYYHPEDLKLWSTPIPTTSNSSELSSLPSTWHIIVTKENREAVSKWRYSNIESLKNSLLDIGQLTGISKKGGSPEHNPGDIISGGSGDYAYNFGTEITFEQFKKWVLKETPKQSTTNIMIDKMNDEIPEYVECIKATRNTVWYSDSIGKIFKVVGIYKDNNFYIEHQGKTDTYLMSFDDCIRSSLSAYEAQFTKSAKSLDLVEGTWYKIKAFEDQYEYWVNYKKDWKSCNHIYNKTYYGLGSFVKVSVICELSPDEYEQYLPKTKVDETKTIKNEETMDFIWYRRTNSNLLSCDTKNNRLEVAWKVNKSTKHGVLSILANGETSSYVTMPPLSNLVTCTEEEANSYFKELIDVPRDKVNPSTYKEATNYSTSSEITWEELLRSDGRWVNFHQSKDWNGKGLIVVEGSKVFILSTKVGAGHKGYFPNSGVKDFSSYGEIFNKTGGYYYKNVIQSWASGPSNLVSGTNSSNYIIVDTTISPIYSVGVDPYYEDRKYDVCVKFKEEEPKLINLSDDVTLLKYKEEKQTLLKID